MSIEALKPFFTEMRNELVQANPDLEQWVAVMATSAGEDPLLMEALENYDEQLERIGQTAEMIGMPGLNIWCNSLNAILPDIVAMEGDARTQACQELSLWPALVDQYFQAPGDFEASMSLAEFLSAPSFSQPFDEAASISLIESLTTPPVVPEELLAQLAESEAPVSVTIEDVSLALPDDADRDVYDAFLDEAPSNVEQFSALTSKIAAGQADVDDMRNAKRIAHSFKGSANIVGIKGVATLGHHTEDVLEYFEKNPVRPPRALGKSLLIASDCLAQMVGYLRGDESAPDNAFEVLSEIVAWANKVKSGEIASMTDDAEVEVAAGPVSTTPVEQTAPPPAAESEPQATLRVPVGTVDEIFRLVGEMAAKIARFELLMSHVNTRTEDLVDHNVLVRKRVEAIEKLVMIRGLSLTRTDATSDESFDPLEMDRYTEMHTATRALVEAAADVREMTDSLEDGVTQLRSEVSQQNNINKELQYQVVSTRLAPVNSLSARLVRNVRQTCQQTGKQAELIITGGEIEVDGDVLNKLADPLLHLLRNAVDHGIELPDERVAADKPAEGTVNLIFARQGSGIVVTIQDDGKGLDYERIRTKAVAQNLISEEQQLSHLELARLVLLPGFSTREQVSEISGRGVGMDVVATRLANIKGTVELTSEPGHGCKVVLRFQASLVTQHTLLVEAGEQQFAVPIHYIKEAFPAGVGQITRAQVSDDNDPSGDSEWVFTMRDESYPLRDLTPLTGFPAKAPDIESYSAMPIIVIRTMSGDMAVLVERLIDSRSVMVKNMGEYLPHVHGISGVTLMGDGSVVPLLNVPELLAEPISINSAVADLAAAARKNVRRVLVVDDSLSVRKGVMQLLQDAAYEVKGAGDGMEAIRMLESFEPQLICTDMEMPNMNGLELAQHLRLYDATSHLPVIMITSRSTEKHRDQAMNSGVNVYLTKPYSDSDLLHHVHTLLQDRMEQGKAEEN